MKMNIGGAWRRYVKTIQPEAVRSTTTVGGLLHDANQ
jgi:hypothetical protein